MGASYEEIERAGRAEEIRRGGRATRTIRAGRRGEITRPTAPSGVVRRHATRGLLIGSLAGIAVGASEGWLVQAWSPVARTALREAFLYAVVVDGLTGAFLGALMAALLAWLASRGTLFRQLSPERSERRLLRLHLAGSLAFVPFAAGFLWFDQHYQASLRQADLTLPSPLVFFPLLLVASIAGAATLHRLLGHTVTAWLLEQQRVTTLGTALVGGVLLAVLPAQVLLESQRYAPATSAASAAEAAGGDMQDGATRLQPTAASPRPNLVVITVDALRADYLGACRAPGATDPSPTPNLDRLAAHGTVFCRAYVHQPQTNPSLTSLFTGRYPASHEVRLHMTDRLPGSVPTLATVARRAGYNTAALVSWTSLKPAFSGLQQGFETYEAAALNEPWYLDQPLLQAAAGVYRRIKDQLWLGRSVGLLEKAQSSIEEEIDGHAIETTDRAIDWLEQAPREPFFLWLHYFDPHWPWTPPAAPVVPGVAPSTVTPPSSSVYDGSLGTFLAHAAGQWAPLPQDVAHLRAVYRGEVEYTDAQIGRLLDSLEAAGLAEDTVVVLTADHGEGLGERDLWVHGEHLSEPGLHVPLLFAGAGVPEGEAPPQLARQVDVLPTLLELLDLPPVDTPDGRSLLPMMRGTADGSQYVSFAQTRDDSSLAVLTGDLWKLVIDYRRQDTDRVALFYLADDPQEQDNRAAREPERVRALTEELMRWKVRQG